MTAAFLREFMPYGAPELQEAARPNMVRALALSSLIASLGFALAWSVSAVVPDPVSVSVPAPDPHDLAREFEILRPPPPIEPIPIARPRPAQEVDAVPVPAKDTPDNVARTIPSQGEASKEISTSTGGAGTARADVAQPDVPVDLFSVDELPSPVKVVKPTYSDMAWQAQVEGVVLVNALVGKDGRVQEVRVDPKVNVPLLNEAALEAARQWVFTPALTNKHPVSVWVNIPFRFTLRD
jgi:TonB family protein